MNDKEDDVVSQGGLTSTLEFELTLNPEIGVGSVLQEIELEEKKSHVESDQVKPPSSEIKDEPSSNEKRACVRKLIDSVMSLYDPILKNHSQMTYSKTNLSDKDS